MAMVTSGRLIFSNRVELEALPRHIQKRAQELELADAYNPESIRAAAEEYFEVTDERALGRIPLWVLRAR